MPTKRLRTLPAVAVAGLALSAVVGGLSPAAALPPEAAPCDNPSDLTHYWCGYSVAGTTLSRKQYGKLWSKGTYARDLSSKSIVKTAGGSNQWWTGSGDTVGGVYGSVYQIVYCDIGDRNAPGGIRISCDWKYSAG